MSLRPSIGLAAIACLLIAAQTAGADIMQFHPLQNQSATDQYYDYGDCYLTAGQESGLIQGDVASTSALKSGHAISRVIAGNEGIGSGTTGSIGPNPAAQSQLKATDSAQLGSYEKLFAACMLTRGYSPAPAH